jgi:hypothetical protein
MKVKLKTIYANASGTHGVDEVIDVPQSEAQDLILHGFAMELKDSNKAEVPMDEQAPPMNAPKNNEPDIVQEIVEAIGLLDPENPDHYTKGKKPEVAALEEILGKDITAAQRDKAFEIYQGK